MGGQHHSGRGRKEDDMTNTPADWLAAAYPIPACYAEKDNAIEASLVKWRHLRASVLAEYGLVARREAVRVVSTDAIVLRIGSSTCALCFLYNFYYSKGCSEGCAACPLSIARDGVVCDRRRRDELTSPYHAMILNGDPEPMIAWLEKAASAVLPDETQNQNG